MSSEMAAAQPASAAVASSSAPQYGKRPSAAASIAATTAVADAAAGGGNTVSHRRTCAARSEEHTSELQSRQYLVRRLLLEKNTPALRHWPPFHLLPPAFASPSFSALRQSATTASPQPFSTACLSLCSLYLLYCLPRLVATI